MRVSAQEIPEPLPLPVCTAEPQSPQAELRQFGKEQSTKLGA